MKISWVSNLAFLKARRPDSEEKPQPIVAYFDGYPGMLNCSGLGYRDTEDLKVVAHP